MSTLSSMDEASLKAIGLDEKQIGTLLKLLGTRCVILSIASLKLFSITEPPEHVHWKRREKCVATVVKECHKDSGVEVVVFNLDKKKIYWEKAMPSAELEYKLIKPLFHLILDVDEGMVGLNFKSAEEAAAFAEVLTKHLAVDDRSSTISSASDSDSGKVKVEDRLHYHLPHEEHLEVTDSTSTTTVKSSSNSTTTTSSSSSSSSKFSLFKHLIKPKTNSSNKAGKLAKERISSAYDFAHIHHMAYDADKAGFTYDYLDAGAKYNVFKTKRDIFSGQNLEVLLEAAGVTQSELNGEEVVTKKTTNDSDDDESSKSVESSTDGNLDDDEDEDPPPSNSGPPKLKISTVSENLELSKIMTELKLYQRESYYTKDFAYPLTPKIVDFQPKFDEDEEDEEEPEKEEESKEEDEKQEENAFEKKPPPLPPPSLGTASAPPVRKDLFAQIGVDAMKAFQNRSIRMSSTTTTTITTNSSAQTLKETVKESNQTTTTTATATIPMPAPRRSKFFPSSENLLQEEQGEEKREEEEKEFRENLI